VVRGQLGGAREQQLLEFWKRRAGFTGDAARQRLSEVVCLVGAEDRIEGASSVFEADLELVGGRRFLVFRYLLDEELEDHRHDLIGATYAAVDADHSRYPRAEGLCVLLEPEQRHHDPRAQWSDPPMVYAGYLRDGRQLRVGYFSDQVNTPDFAEPEDGWRGALGYEIVPFPEQRALSADDVVAAWVGTKALSPRQAQERARELLMIATDSDGGPAAMCTAYLARNAQLRAQVWHLRVFVMPAHRKPGLALGMSLAAREHLVERWVSGQDRRGLGILMEVEHRGLKRRYSKGRWTPPEFLFIGQNEYGDHVRVHYFPGALAPEPDQGRT
jgi:hypothetical protein